MAKYQKTDWESGQMSLRALDLRAQLIPWSFEWALHEIVEHKLDFSAFDAEYQNDHEGRPAKNPRSLLKLVLYGYSRGVLSSRRLERLNRCHLVALALAGGDEIDHSTIAQFVSGNSDKIKSLFADILLYCMVHNLGKCLNALKALNPWAKSFKTPTTLQALGKT